MLALMFFKSCTKVTESNSECEIKAETEKSSQIAVCDVLRGVCESVLRLDTHSLAGGFGDGLLCNIIMTR